MSFVKKIRNKFSTAQFDWVLFSVMASLLVISVFFIYSAGLDSKGQQIHPGRIPEYIKQVIWIITGFVLFRLTFLLDDNNLIILSMWVYLFTLVLLLLVLLTGKYVAGARSWLGIGFLGIQPSELAKISCILILASFFDAQGTKAGATFKNLAIAGILVGIPMLLIMLQPDFGSASVFMSIFFAMALFAKVSAVLLFLTVFIGGLTALYVLLPLWDEHIATRNMWLTNILTDPILSKQLVFATLIVIALSGIGWFIYKKKSYAAIAYISIAHLGALYVSLFLRGLFKPYQVKRLLTFLKPEIDPLGGGWQITQSLNAIGSGGLWGKGFLNGNHSHLQYLPEQSTDFIFSIILEETGFIGGCVVVLLYFVLICRLVHLLYHSHNPFCRYLCAGTFGLFAFHCSVNIGMVLGLMPITGIPLLLLSYGGSSIWASMLILGIVMSRAVKPYYRN